jgi:hypothetical protein
VRVLARTNTSAASVKLRDGTWLDLEAGYLSSGQELADLIDRWRASALDRKSTKRPKT